MMRHRQFRLIEDEKVDTDVHPLALKAREMAKGDEKAGHKDAAHYWRGWAAGSFLTGNKGLSRESLNLLDD